MKKAWTSVKSFVTIMMTFGMLYMLIFNPEVDKDILVIFSTAYGSIMTYFFTRKDENKTENEEIERSY